MRKDLEKCTSEMMKRKQEGSMDGSWASCVVRGGGSGRMAGGWLWLSALIVMWGRAANDAFSL